QVKILKQISVGAVNEIKGESDPRKHVITFTDFGTGQKALIANALSDFQVLILDHHKPAPGSAERHEPGSGNLLELNPHYHGIDGGREVSGAGVTYFFAKALDGANVDCAPLAVVGAVGDRQDNGDNFQLTGLNGLVLDDGRANGLVADTVGIRVFGRETRPLTTALANTMFPYFPGLSGNEAACASFFQQIQVPLEDPRGTPRTFADLDEEEVKEVISSLMSVGIVRYGMEPEQVNEFIGTIYYFPREPRGSFTRDSREFSFLLNSCGRLGHPGLGIAIGMGARGHALEEAESVISDYRRTLARSLNLISERHLLAQKKNLQYFYGGSDIPERVVGTVASLVLSSPSGNKDKIIVALADTEDPATLKVSLRGPAHVVENRKTNPLGVNLAKIMHEATDHFHLKNPAGGHAAACGAYIPADIRDEFLDFVDERVGSWGD
ncbi:MAG: DHHA1 domain-containing protein, partial [Promethearchaeota archaeon]